MIRTTVVGSYPVPTWLRVVSTRESLRDAILAVLKTQELAGIDVVADGELYRWDVNHAETNGMIDYFVRPLEGVRQEMSREEIDRWRSRQGMKYRSRPAGIVTGAVGEGGLNLRDDYELFRDLTPCPKKFTVTSPYMLAKVLADEHYRDLENLTFALAEVLCRQLADIDADVVQVDEANVTGHPDDGGIAARGIQRVLESVRGEKAVHLCFGNYGGQTVQKGTYRKLIEFLNALEVDHVVLELARRPAEELEWLRDVKPPMRFGVGVVDIKDNEVESPETVARRIQHAATVLGPERLAYVHPDCGFWMLPRSVADAKMRALVKGRDIFLGAFGSR
jgi:5-methyltetrahydropteroyltriglutamate--homocysteine methyltransferase